MITTPNQKRFSEEANPASDKSLSEAERAAYAERRKRAWLLDELGAKLPYTEALAKLESMTENAPSDLDVTTPSPGV